jgi:hypothetical protein
LGCLAIHAFDRIARLNNTPSTTTGVLLKVTVSRRGWRPRQGIQALSFSG